MGIRAHSLGSLCLLKVVLIWAEVYIQLAAVTADSPGISLLFHGRAAHEPHVCLQVTPRLWDRGEQGLC